MLTRREERDSLRDPTEVEAQLEEPVAERARVWHPERRALLRQAVDMEGHGRELGGRQSVQPRTRLRFQLDRPV